MKIKYKIYATPYGAWVAEWELDREQYNAARNLEWYHHSRPTKVYTFRAHKNRGKEKEKLEQKCKEYATLLCEQIEHEREAKRLKEEAPMIEHGCES